jgi:hypothetical protein
MQMIIIAEGCHGKPLLAEDTSFRLESFRKLDGKFGAFIFGFEAGYFSMYIHQPGKIELQ